LTVIEGIGPKVNAALNAAGITTYAQVARASEVEMREALLRAGMIPPKSLETWPRQAAFAVQGDWPELYKYNAKRKLAAKK
jgi:predicted flap endonuclease-1-like 5' DNA nuclease